MAKSSRYRRDDRIGPWCLDRRLGAGGNGDVWRAVAAPGHSTVALKILRSTDRQSERYVRFRAEVEAHAFADATGCVLPMLGNHFPDNPTPGDPAWMSMPLARTIKAALGKHPALERVVAAAVEVAEDLVVLRERGVAHRDIKPSNLFAHEGRWVIGDLGLATFPGKRALTRTGRQIGPMYFIAPEMITDAKRANPHRVDMFSLSQTLFVLATGQNYPPSGGVRMNDRQTTLGAWVQDPRVGSLDALLERGTAHDPDHRPSFEEFATELRTWLGGPPPKLGPLDLSSLAARATALVAPGIAAAGRVEQAKRATRQLAERAYADVARIEASIQEALPGFVGGTDLGFADIVTKGESRKFGGWRHLRDVRGFVAPGTSAFALWSGMTMQMKADGDVLVVAAHVVAQTNVLGDLTHLGVPEPHVAWKDVRTVRVDSAGADAAVAEQVAGLAHHAHEAVAYLLDKLQGLSTA